MLVHSEEGVVRFLPAKPKEWKSGSIKGLLLRGGIVLESLEWQDDDFSAILRFPDGTLKRVNGKAGTLPKQVFSSVAGFDRMSA